MPVVWWLILALVVEQSEPDPTSHMPPLSDLRRFPAHHTAMQQRRKWQEHLDWLGSQPRCYLDYRESIRRRQWLEQSLRAFDAWDALEDAQSDLDDAWQRARLNDLKKLLTPDAFLKGQMPPRLPAGLHLEPEKTPRAGVR